MINIDRYWALWIVVLCNISIIWSLMSYINHVVTIWTIHKELNEITLKYHQKWLHSWLWSSLINLEHYWWYLLNYKEFSHNSNMDVLRTMSINVVVTIWMIGTVVQSQSMFFIMVIINFDQYWWLLLELNDHFWWGCPYLKYRFSFFTLIAHTPQLCAWNRSYETLRVSRNYEHTTRHDS